MREKVTLRAHRYTQLAFVATVTAILLASVFEQTGAGVRGIPGMVVYAFAAGFGLEFISSVWTGRGNGSERRRREARPRRARNR
jgi:hypothetical protein